jgi:hypothetical protein
MADRPPRVLFTAADAEAAWEAWGCNCGPGAIAGVLGMTLDQVRPHLPGFETKRYTNPSMMWAALRSLDRRFSVSHATDAWPRYGLARIQWEGPWTRPGVPPAAAYRHTHWVGSFIGADGVQAVFDINAMSAGGWITRACWSGDLVPWLLAETTPRATGGWYVTHGVELLRDA